jgi:alpha-D-ribose 1-methylphosphonate 5-triphosphate synthase subunit PhnH
MKSTTSQSATSRPFAAGFRDPVFDSQAVFRAVMNAMARPGHIETITTPLSPPAPLNVAADASCLALADFETPIWLSAALKADSQVEDYIRFHCGASVVTHSEQAAYALVDIRSDALDLASFAQGTLEYPDRGATVILICDTLSQAKKMAISGPGLAGEAGFGFSPMPADFSIEWQKNRAGFPLGVDLIVTSANHITCLPRSARIIREAA